MLWRRPDPTEARLLVLPAPDPQRPGPIWCAGGPVGLLDLATTGVHTEFWKIAVGTGIIGLGMGMMMAPASL